ncbi:hypothetical protein BCR33DRAFT_856421 [Rhizoclosmatium globosum]|uniref:Zinc/iron permease n=1 Tax=Rhizoclosmatium globosum TaxID=329046 RepID=A0A1Y2BCZ9_9FUNG|nr:hypothetical protein BCR33DRAFT_856421 [Rhizoclosmatium globosum]|eukprot:ORY32693.1 hypothetical protein BCR33DRAFT_856421 [Rhizoclosmatium globosum]
MSTSTLPLFLAIVAGAGTTFGAVILLVLIPNPPPVNTLSASNAALFGRLQACSAGVMVALSLGLFFESLPVAGFPSSILCVFVGAALMAAIEWLLHSTSHSNEGCNNEIHEGELGLLEEHITEDLEKQNSFATPSAFEAFLMKMFGATSSGANTISMVRSSFVTYMGLALHNLPEGVSVALTTVSNLKLGISLCIAILLHNVLEGMIVALPLWYTSRSKSRVLFLTLLNGLMEPLGVIIAWCLGGAEIISKPGRIEKMLAGVSGIMATIAFGELLPSAIEWIEKGGIGNHGKPSMKDVYIRVFAWIVIGVIGGAAVMGSADFVLQHFAF